MWMGMGEQERGEKRWLKPSKSNQSSMQWVCGLQTNSRQVNDSLLGAGGGGVSRKTLYLYK